MVNAEAPCYLKTTVISQISSNRETRLLTSRTLPVENPPFVADFVLVNFSAPQCVVTDHSLSPACPFLYPIQL